MTDHTDLIRRLLEATDEEMAVAGMFQDQGRHMDASYHDARAAEREGGSHDWRNYSTKTEGGYNG